MRIFPIAFGNKLWLMKTYRKRAMFKTLGTTTPKKRKAKNNLGLIALATGYFMRSKRKVEEHARLKEIRLRIMEMIS